MKNVKAIAVSLVLIGCLCPSGLKAQEETRPDSVAEKPNEFDISAQLLTRGEYRKGGLHTEEDKHGDMAAFVLERMRLTMGYKRKFLEMRITGQHSGVWGQTNKGSFNIYEAWGSLTAKNGLFAKVGRQVLSYDDERIMGSNDWTMAALSHDVVKAGYEGHGHKAHVIIAFNQNAENAYGGTYYVGGGQAYKTMQVLWYHYDVPRIPLSLSATFMNIGMQHGATKEEYDTKYQQLTGGYIVYHPRRLKTEASFYYQSGKSENAIPIEAWMLSLRASYQLSPQWKIHAGYDYLTGDENFAVPHQGTMGLTHHKKMKGFSPLYGSHHQFYGAMDFFYVSAYIDGFSPGLQNLYGGATWSPRKNLNFSAAYHYMGTTADILEHNKVLGHEMELNASWNIIKDVNLSLGYSLMRGSETMLALKRTDSDRLLQWAWLSLNFSPRIFSTRW